jgi:hypothetical protein
MADAGLSHVPGFNDPTARPFLNEKGARGGPKACARNDNELRVSTPSRLRADSEPTPSRPWTDSGPAPHLPARDEFTEAPMSSIPDAMLRSLDRLVGAWRTEATHPAMPGVVVHGTVHAEWLEGERFLIHRARSDHPDFPDSISIIGFTGYDRVGHSSGSAPADEGAQQLRMHYFDSRGVSRVFEVGIDEGSWRFWRNAPGFSQRFTGTWADGGDTIVGLSQLSRDDVRWDDDLAITYRRRE